jgi:hypothetical protein
MPTTDYRMQMQFEVTADPGQSFTLTEQDVTITTKKVHVSFNISGPRAGSNKPPHCEVQFYGYSDDEHVAEVFVPGRKVAGNGMRWLPAEVIAHLREVAPEMVRDALAERPAKVKR